MINNTLKKRKNTIHVEIKNDRSGYIVFRVVINTDVKSSRPITPEEVQEVRDIVTCGIGKLLMDDSAWASVSKKGEKA